MSKVKNLSYRVFRVLMVVMLLLGFSVIPAGATSPPLQVDVHAPEQVYVCTCFYVNATIANPTHSPISDISVEIYWDSWAAELLDPDVPMQWVGHLEPGAVADVWWKFHCLEPGPLRFDVYANAYTGEWGEGFATVEQVPVPDPVLVVEIIQSPDYVVTPCENFAIKAKIHNVTNEPVNMVNAWIKWKGDAAPVGPFHFNVGTIEAGGSQEVGFTLHCEGPEDVEVEVDADFDGWAPGQVMPARVGVVQAGTTIEVELSTDTDKLCPCCPDMDTAIVTATVYNTGDETATGVEVTIEKTGGGAVISPPLTVSLGDIPVGGSAEARWAVTCNAVGDVDLEATATATNIPDPPPAVVDQLSIEQGEDLLVDILEPEPGRTFSFCQDFEVKARFMNCSGNPILLKATLEPLLQASLAPGSEVLIEPSWVGSWTVPGTLVVDVGNLCPCCWVDITWTLHCDGTGDGYIWVYADGDLGQFDAEESVWVDQEEKAHLAAGIEVFPGWASDNTLNVMPVDAVAVCDNFTVVVVVANLGEADAEDVTFTKVITGATSCAGSHSYGPVTIKGGESLKFIQECHCDAEGLVGISVTGLSGTDENTGAAIPDDNIDIPEPKILHQKLITVEFLEPYEGEEFIECDFFAVKVKIHNGSDQDLAGVGLLLEWTEGQAELVGGAPGWEIGTLLAGATHEFTWQMHCYHKGELTFFLKLISEYPRMKIERQVTVIQKPAPPDWKYDEVPLCQLWNLMSLPLIPEDPDIERVLSRTAAEIKKVAHYTGGPAGTWKFYSPSAPSDLTQMVDGKGYWMDVGATTGPPPPTDILRVWGYEHAAPPPAVPPYYEVVEGWNMIGFQSMTPKLAANYLAAIADDLMVIYRFDCMDQSYYIVPPGGSLYPGAGYLIALTGPGTIYP